MRRSRGARVARSLKSEVGGLENVRVLSPRRLFLTQSRRGAEDAEVCLKKRTGKVPAGLISIENVLSAPMPSPDGSPVPIPVGRSGEDFSFGFSTKYHDREVGLVAYQLRSYSPRLGRWLNRDPLSTLGDFIYCMNNPVAFIDVAGLHSIVINTRENPNRSNVLQTLEADSRRLNNIKWGRTALDSGFIKQTKGIWRYDSKCKSCFFVVPPTYYGSMDYLYYLVHAEDKFMGYKISKTFADQVKNHEGKHVAIARGLLRVFSDAESEIGKLIAFGLTPAACHESLKRSVNVIDASTMKKFWELEAKISETLDSVEKVSFERGGFLWLSEQPIMTGNFDVDAEIYSELSKSK